MALILHYAIFYMFSYRPTKKKLERCTAKQVEFAERQKKLLNQIKIANASKQKALQEKVDNKVQQARQKVAERVYKPIEDNNLLEDINAIYR